MYRVSIIGAGNVATQFAIAFQRAGHSVICVCNRDLEKAEQFESEKNKLTFDTEIEQIYIVGDFSVNTDGNFHKLDRNA